MTETQLDNTQPPVDNDHVAEGCEKFSDETIAANANVYEGEADARQGGAYVKPSRFRPVYRALTEQEKALHDAIKAQAATMEDLYAQIKPAPGRYTSLALTALEESVMWAVKELTS